MIKAAGGTAIAVRVDHTVDWLNAFECVVETNQAVSEAAAPNEDREEKTMKLS